VTIARKKKGSSDWFLGAISDEEARSQKISLRFLDPGARYEATRYMDSPDAHWKNKPAGYVIDKIIVDQQTILDIRMAPGGGTAIRFRKL
jgi:glucan 1,4-alpha-glucosidase